MERHANEPVRKEFGFGIEAEFMLIDHLTGVPRWHRDVDFETLYSVFEAIDVSDMPTAGLKLEPPHRRLLPYVVEGYHLPDAELNPIDLLPKGVEIRTPLASDVTTCINRLEALFERLREPLRNIGFAAAALSHHPVATRFTGPQNKRRHDFWRWAMQAMVTYGPDINVSVPTELEQRLDPDELGAKVNYYGPALAALSLNAPFFGGELWRIHGRPGRSVRTYNRSIFAPAIELHPDQAGRLEFKLFEASPYLGDYEAFTLLWLTLILDSELDGRASQQDRVYALGEVAERGLEARYVAERADEVLMRAARVLPSWGFATEALAPLARRLETRRTIADELIDRHQGGESLEKILLSLVPTPSRPSSRHSSASEVSFTSL